MTASPKYLRDRTRVLPAALLALGASLLLSAAAWAQSVSAELSQPSTAVGQPVQLSINVVGGRSADIANHMTAPGLDLRFMGRSEQVNIVNFKINVSSTYSFVVTPSQEGNLVIPPIPVRVGGKVYKTQPLALQVGDAGSVPVAPAAPAPQPGSQFPGLPSVPSVPPPAQSEPTPLPDDKITFAELIIPKKSAYVGEVVPVELRFYFADGYPVQLSEHPNFSGDGFTVMNFSNHSQRQQEVNGQLYNVVVFQTALVPVKSGSLNVPAASLDARIQLPGQPPAGMPDVFSQFFANTGFGAETRQLTVSTKGSHLDVKPLPAEGRPDDFSGAIGQFSLRATAAPKKADPGDPITLTATIAGRGNFDGMNAPTLAGDEDWKTYPPSDTFKASPSDPIGYNGEKSFSYMIVARTDTKHTPSTAFSFFDPSLSRYVTLKAPPIAVDAQGSSALPPPAAVATASSTPTPSAATPATAPAPTATPAVADLHPATFQPFVLDHRLLLVNSAAAVIWLLAFAAGFVRLLATSDYARQSQQRRENRRLLHRLDDPRLTPEEFLKVSLQFVRDRLAPSGSVSDTHELVDHAALTADTRENIRALLRRGDEWNYSSGSSSHLDMEERHQIISQLKTFDEEI